MNKNKDNIIAGKILEGIGLFILGCIVVSLTLYTLHHIFNYLITFFANTIGIQ